MKLFDLTGKVALVTGATHGLGMAMARGLGEAGARLVINGHSSQSRLDQAVEAYLRDGLDAAGYLFDVTDENAVEEAVDRIEAEIGPIDVLVNNAGVWHLRRRPTLDGLEEMFQVNVLAPFLLTSLLRPQLRAAAPSRVITVTSHAHVVARMQREDHLGEPPAGLGLDPVLGYARTKQADVILARELARRLRRDRITSNAVAPGGVRTKLAAEFGQPALGFMFLFAKHPAEGADPIVWLASAPALATVTGGYFVGRAGRRLLRAASDPAAGARLWRRCEELTGLSTEPD